MVLELMESLGPSPVDDLIAVVSRILRHDMLATTGVRPQAMATAEEMFGCIDVPPVLLAIVKGALPGEVKERFCSEAMEREDGMKRQDDKDTSAELLSREADGEARRAKKLNENGRTSACLTVRHGSRAAGWQGRHHRPTS